MIDRDGTEPISRLHSRDITETEQRHSSNTPLLLRSRRAARSPARSGIARARLTCRRAGFPREGEHQQRLALTPGRCLSDTTVLRSAVHPSIHPSIHPSTRPPAALPSPTSPARFWSTSSQPVAAVNPRGCADPGAATPPIGTGLAAEQVQSARQRRRRGRRGGFVTIDMEAILATDLARRANVWAVHRWALIAVRPRGCGVVHLRAWITAPRLVIVTGVVTCSAAATASWGATNRAIR
jgi:hypothetical protein